MLTPYTTEVSLEIRFFSLHRVRFPMSYNPRFAHTLLALSKILGLYVCILKKFLGLTVIRGGLGSQTGRGKKY